MTPATGSPDSNQLPTREEHQKLNGQRREGLKTMEVREKTKGGNDKNDFLIPTFVLCSFSNILEVLGPF